MDATFVGLNATSQTIEVAVRPTGEIWRTDFADETINATATKLKHMQPTLVVMEATGTYELPVAGIFATVGLPFAIVNPRSIREFSRAVGRISRLDFTQADMLAYFGELEFTMEGLTYYLSTQVRVTGVCLAHEPPHPKPHLTSGPAQ